MAEALRTGRISAFLCIKYWSTVAIVDHIFILASVRSANSARATQPNVYILPVVIAPARS